MTTGKWFDAAGKPDPHQAARQGFTGAFLYFGTPGYAKNSTTAYYQAVVAAGLAVIGVVEHTQHDAELGAPAGAAYARAALADMATQGASGIPLGVTADEHLTAAQIPTAIAFQAAASQVIRAAGRKAVGYGFAEYLHALRPGRWVDIEWQAGARSAVDAVTHFWQDNTGTEMVGPVVVDRDWQLREYTMPVLDQTDLANIANAVVQALITFRVAGPDGAPRNLWDSDYQERADDLAEASALTADVKALLAAIHTGVDVPTLATALAPVLAPLIPPSVSPAAVGEATVTALEARLAAGKPAA